MDKRDINTENAKTAHAPMGMDALPAIGRELARVRKEKGITRDTIAARLRLPVAQVRALEKGDPSPFPGDVYVIGHVRGFANTLKIDPAPLCARLRKTASGNTHDKKAHGGKADAGSVSDFIPAGLVHRHSSAGRMAMMAVGIFALAYGGWYAWDTGLIGSGGGSDDGGVVSVAEIPVPVLEIDPASTTIVESANGDNGGYDAPDTTTTPIIDPAPAVVVEAQSAPAPSANTQAADAIAPEIAPETVPQTADEPATPRAGQAIAHNRNPESEIIIRASSVSWVEITRADGSTVSSGLMRAGDEYIVPGDESVYLTTGNAGGLEIELKGAGIGKLGAIGETISELPLDPELLSERY